MEVDSDSIVCHNAAIINIDMQFLLRSHPKYEEVVLMDSYYAKRTVALPSRESK